MVQRYDVWDEYAALRDMCDELAESIRWNREVMIFAGESTKLHDELEQIFHESVIDMSRKLAKYEQFIKEQG